MRSEEHERLIDDYLQGRSDEAAIRQIDGLAREDDGFREALVMAAALQAALGERSAAGGGPALAPGPGRSWLAGFAAAAAAAAAVAAAAGWLWVTAMPGHSDTCRVVETRGLVLLLPETPTERATPLATGDVVEAGRRISTCPWGAVALRLGDGSRIQFDRGSVARLLSTSRPEVDLVQGIVFVTRHRGLESSVTVTSQHASLAIDHGLAAMTTDTERTVIEIAEGDAWLCNHPAGERTRIADGQITVVEQDQAGGIQIRPGRLRWELPAGPEG